MGDESASPELKVSSLFFGTQGVSACGDARYNQGPPISVMVHDIEAVMKRAPLLCRYRMVWGAVLGLESLVVNQRSLHKK